MKTITTGWAIIHPSGWVEMDYFNFADFNECKFPNTSARQQEIMDSFVKTYRPDCRVERVRVIPFEEEA